MKNRGKREVETYNNEGDYYGDDDIPQFTCTKHPNSSSSAGGICAYCLTDKLAELVCPQCGEQRYPSCSCSGVYTDPNWGSSATADAARISFFLENDKQGTQFPSSKSRAEHRSSFYEQRSTHFDDYSGLQRSNSISAPRSSTSESNKFWKFGKLFRKKKDKSNQQYQINEEPTNNNECNKFTRSRSVCNYRGFYDTDESANFPVSSSAARASSVSTGNFALESAKMSCFSESEARFSNFEARSSNFDYVDASNFVNPNRNNIFSSLRETEFVSSDDPAYIDLKLHDMSSSDYSSRHPPDLAAMKRTGFGLSTKEFGFRGRGGGGDFYGHDMYNNGGRSCRMSSVSDRDLKKGKKGYKVWKWFSKQHNNSGKFDDHNAYNS